MKNYNIKQELNKIVSLCIDKGKRIVYLQEGSCLECRWSYEKDGNVLNFELQYWENSDKCEYLFSLKDKNEQEFIIFKLNEYLSNINYETIVNFINCVNILGFYDE